MFLGAAAVYTAAPLLTKILQEMGKTFTDLCNMTAKEIRWLIELAKSKYAESQAASQSATAVAAPAAPDPYDGGNKKNSHLSKQQSNKYKSNILEGKDVNFKTKEEAIEFIKDKFPEFNQEVAGSRSSEGWHFDSHPINGSAESIEHINIYSKRLGFRVHITWG